MSVEGDLFDRDFKTKTIQAAANGNWGNVKLQMPSMADVMYNKLKKHAIMIDRCVIEYRHQCPINSEGSVRIQVHDSRMMGTASKQAEFVMPVTCNCDLTFYGSCWSSASSDEMPWKMLYRLENSNLKTGTLFCRIKGRLKLCASKRVEEIEFRSPRINILSKRHEAKDIDMWHVEYATSQPTLNRVLSCVDRRRLSSDSITVLPGMCYSEISRRSIAECDRRHSFEVSSNVIADAKVEDIRPEDSVSQTSSVRRDQCLAGSTSIMNADLVDILQIAMDRGKKSIFDSHITKERNKT